MRRTSRPPRTLRECQRGRGGRGARAQPLLRHGAHTLETIECATRSAPARVQRTAALPHASARCPDSDDIPGGMPVIVTSYNFAMADAAYLSRVHWRVLVVDEGHRCVTATRGVGPCRGCDSACIHACDCRHVTSCAQPSPRLRTESGGVFDSMLICFLSRHTTPLPHAPPSPDPRADSRRNRPCSVRYSARTARRRRPRPAAPPLPPRRRCS